MNAVSPGWYPDPGSSGQLRYWDGSAWTAHVAATANVPVSVPVPAAETAPALAPTPKGIVPRRAVIGLVALAAAMVVIISAGSSVVNTIWDTRMAELADEEEKLNASFPSDVDAMNVAMQSGDREAFIAAGEKEGVEQLARLWDETKKIGWKTGVVTGGGYADEDHDEKRVSMMFSFDLGFELDDATGDEINGGTSMLHGFEYVVNLGEYTEGEGGYGRGRLIQSIEPVIPMPWDSPDGVYAARTEHAVAFGAASDREYIDARSAAAERAATFVLDTLAPELFVDQIPGLVTIVTSDASQYKAMASRGSSIESRAVMMPTARTHFEGISSTSAPLVALSPMDEADVAEVLVHEFTHSVQRATIGESELFSGGNARPAFIEGHATYVQHLFAGTTDEFTSDTVRSAVAGDLNWLLGANGGFADQESVNRAYLVAGAYFYYLANTDGNMSTFVREGVKEAGYNLPGVPLIDPYPHDQTSWKEWLATQ